MSIVEKAAYLRGLADGLEIDTDKKEGKLLLAMVDVISEMADSVADLEDVTDEMSNELDEVAEELIEIEDALDDECDCCDDDDCDCEDCEGDYHYEVKCPTCGDSIMVDEGILELGKINCPNCNEELEFDLGCDDGCDCEQ